MSLYSMYFLYFLVVVYSALKAITPYVQRDLWVVCTSYSHQYRILLILLLDKVYLVCASNSISC